MGLSTETAQYHGAIQKLGYAEKWGIRLMGVFGMLAVACAGKKQIEMARTSLDASKNREQSSHSFWLMLAGDLVQASSFILMMKFPVRGFWGFILGPKGANVILLLGSLMVYAGMWLYNSHQRTLLQRWLEHSAWGVEDQNWSPAEQGAEFAQVVYAPKVFVQRFWSLSGSVGPRSVVFLFRLHNFWFGGQSELGIGQIRAYRGFKKFWGYKPVFMDDSAYRKKLVCIANEPDFLEFFIRIDIERAASLEIDFILHHPEYADKPMYAPNGLTYHATIAEDALNYSDVELLHPREPSFERAATHPFHTIHF